MKIGLYSPYLDTLAGGEKYMLSVATCLSSDHDVSLFWSKNEEGEIKKEVLRKFNMDISSLQFVENIFTPANSLISRLQETRKYDVLIVLSDGSIPVVASKLILHFQTPMPWITPSWKTSLKLKKVSHIICNSTYTQKYIDKEFGVKSEVIYPPVVIDKTDDKKENIILHVGRFGITNEGSSAKKQELLADIFTKMVDKGLSDWKMVFVMSFKEDMKKKVEEFKDTVKKYPISILENPTNEQLWEAYSKSKIYWHASGAGENLEKNPGRAEHFGISTVEAMGSGAVPIVINAGGQKEIVTEGENGFLWDTPEECMGKTFSVIQDKNLFIKLVENAQTSAKEFSLDRFCDAWTKIII